MNIARRFHVWAPRLKNPYYFYDLQRQQSPASHVPAENPAFPSGRRMFDPLADMPAEPMHHRVSKVFGALGSREESRKDAVSKGLTVAGIHVPARPEEPTNCCMSGCVNCVWELYKDELEEYKAIRRKARHKLAEPQFDHVQWPAQLGPEPSARKARVSSTEQHPTPDHAENAMEEEDDDELSESIKVFIATEKRLHEQKMRSQNTPA